MRTGINHDWYGTEHLCHALSDSILFNIAVPLPEFVRHACKGQLFVVPDYYRCFDYLHFFNECINSQSTKTESNTKDTSTQNPPEVKLVSSISLIDFDSDPEPVPKRETPPTSNQNRDVGWASFDTQRPSFAAAPSLSANNLETSLVHQPASRPVPGTTYSQMPIQNNTHHQNNVSLFPTVQRSNPQLNGLPAAGPTIQVIVKFFICIQKMILY